MEPVDTRVRLTAKNLPLDADLLVRGLLRRRHGALLPRGREVDALRQEDVLHGRRREGAVRVRGDADRLQQVMWNLLSNAVKFTPDGGSIEVMRRPVRAAKFAFSPRRMQFSCCSK